MQKIVVIKFILVLGNSVVMRYLKLWMHAHKLKQNTFKEQRKHFTAKIILCSQQLK